MSREGQRVGSCFTAPARRNLVLRHLTDIENDESNHLCRFVAGRLRFACGLPRSADWPSGAMQRVDAWHLPDHCPARNRRLFGGLCPHGMGEAVASVEVILFGRF